MSCVRPSGRPTNNFGNSASGTDCPPLICQVTDPRNAQPSGGRTRLTCDSYGRVWDVSQAVKLLRERLEEDE